MILFFISIAYCNIWHILLKGEIRERIYPSEIIFYIYIESYADLLSIRLFCFCECHRCIYNCEKLYCTRWDSNSGPLVYETSALPIELKGIPSSRVSIKRLVCINTCNIFPPPRGSRPRDWRFSRTFASLTRNIFVTQRNTESVGAPLSQMHIQLWKIVLHPLGFELGSFGLRDQCSTDWAKGDSLQPSQYQATGSYKHL